MAHPKTTFSVSRSLFSHPVAASARIGIVVSLFNDFISKDLLYSCVTQLQKAGVKDRQITTVWVPGAFEIPLAAQQLAGKANIDAVICLGAVIRGETYHFEVIADQTARGMMQVALETGKPVIMGVLTTNTIKQAQKRAVSQKDNKGSYAAWAALEMIALLKKLK